MTHGVMDAVRMQEMVVKPGVLEWKAVLPFPVGVAVGVDAGAGEGLGAGDGLTVGEGEGEGEGLGAGLGEGEGEGSWGSSTAGGPWVVEGGRWVMRGPNARRFCSYWRFFA